MKRYKLNVKKWGPAGWNYLIAVALQYPKNPSREDRQHYKNFFYENGYCIPCVFCRSHYQKNLETHPLTDDVLASPRRLSQWINDMRNEVNKQTNKPSVDYLDMVSDYLPPGAAVKMLDLTQKEQEALRYFDKQRNSNSEQVYNFCSSWIFWLLLVLVLIFFALFICAIIKSHIMRKG